MLNVSMFTDDKLVVNVIKFVFNTQCMSSQKAPPPPTSNTSLTDELKLFYAGFDRMNTEAPIKAEPPPDDLPLFFNQ